MYRKHSSLTNVVGPLCAGIHKTYANTSECLSLHYFWVLGLEAPWQSPVGYRLPLELRPCFTNPKGKKVFRPNFDVTGKCRLMHHFVWKRTLFFESFIYSKKKTKVFFSNGTLWQIFVTLKNCFLKYALMCSVIIPSLCPD